MICCSGCQARQFGKISLVAVNHNSLKVEIVGNFGQSFFADEKGTASVGEDTTILLNREGTGPATKHVYAANSTLTPFTKYDVGIAGLKEDNNG